jgi:hypothetical protein
MHTLKIIIDEIFDVEELDRKLKDHAITSSTFYRKEDQLEQL